MNYLRRIRKMIQAQYDALDNRRMALGIVGKIEDALVYQQALLYAIKEVDGAIKEKSGLEKLTDVQRAYYAIKDAVELLERTNDERTKLPIAMLGTIKDELFRIDRGTK